MLKTIPMHQRARTRVLMAIGAVVCSWAPAVAATQDIPGQAVVTTAMFALFSDFETNLNDALVSAGLAKKRGKPEPPDASSASACLGGLPAAERSGWGRAVDYYAEVVASGSAADHEQSRIRLELAGVVKDDEREDPAERRFIEITRAIRAAAAPAYRACHWPGQDQVNRRWIGALIPLLNEHEPAIAARLAEAFQWRWAGLPLRVDVVRTVEWSGAHTMLLRPPGAHVLISSANPGYQSTAALEMVFHEASHFLTGRDTPLRKALDDAVRDAGGTPFRGDLIHAVHFYMTGEIVRRRLRQADVAYEPCLYAQGLYADGTFPGAVGSIWPAYLDGNTTLPEAARALVRALEKRGGTE